MGNSIRNGRAPHSMAPSQGRRGALPIVALALGVVGAFTWTYWATIVSLVKEWDSNQDYSVGMLVPLVAIYLVWHLRDQYRSCDFSPCWWGLGLILLAQAARAYGLLFLFESGERYSLVLTIMGLVLLLAGWQAFWRARWLLLFLFLMVPLPGRVHNLINSPLQNYATGSAVFLLEILGVTVSRDGNVMVLNDTTPLAVAEACSGLRMLTAFVVVAAALAFLANRPPWQKGALVVSSVPIAILCNTGRLCITAVLFLVADSETAKTLFHDFAGLAMMPPAVLLLFGELWVMKKLIVPEKTHSAHRKSSAAVSPVGRAVARRPLPAAPEAGPEK